MNDHLLGADLLSDDFDHLSLSQLSKSSPSAFQVKRSRSSKHPRAGKNASNNVSSSGNNNNKQSNLSHVPCKFFKQGICTAGANCVFSHSQDLTSESAVCKYFLKGNCKFGGKCALLHTLSPVDNAGRSKLLQSRRKMYGSNSTSTSNGNYLLVASPPDPRPHLNLARDERASSSSNSSNSSSELTAAIRQNPAMLFGAASAPNAEPSPMEKKFLLSPPAFAPSHSSLLNPLHRRTLSSQEEEEDEEDVLLPSSLNDLLTPAELSRSRDRMLYHPAYHNSPSRDALLGNGRSPLQLSPFDMPPAPPPTMQSSSWHVPFLHRASSSFATADEEPITSSSSKAINIPGDSSHHRFSSAAVNRASPSDEDDDPFSPFSTNDDDTQLFFMQDEPVAPANERAAPPHHFQRMLSAPVAFPSLLHNSVPRS